VHNWENDPRGLELFFVAATDNFRRHTGRVPEALRVKLHAVYKQATQGDCKEPKPFDRRQRERWEEWCKFEGTPPDVAKRRFITLLRTVDPALVTIVVPEEPPPGFPTTAFGDKICARCNSAIGCCQPLLAADGAPLTKKLLADEDILTYERLKEFVVEASDNRRCKWGRHVPIPANMARQFKRWYESAGIGGFEPYNAEKDKTFENVLRVLLGTQFQKLHEMQLIAADLTYKEIAAQVDRCEALQRFYKEFTKREFMYEVECDRETRHCNERREFSNGRNHKHPMEIERPAVDFSVYKGVAALRREVMRLGLSPSTGPASDITPGQSDDDDRKTTLALRIAEHHRKRMVVHEAIRRQKARSNWHPQQKADVTHWSVTQLREQLISAIIVRDFETVAVLVRRGAPTQTEAPGGLTAVVCAAIVGNKRSLTQLIEQGADLDHFNSHGMNAMSWAVKRGDLVMLHHLLDMGAAIALVPSLMDGMPALSVGVRHGQIEVVDVLLEHAEKLGPLEQQRLLNQQNRLGITPLMIAARHRDLRMVRHLMRAGALPTVRDQNQNVASDHARQASWGELAGYIANTRNIGAQGMETYSEKQLERRMRLAYGRLQVAISSGEEGTQQQSATASAGRSSQLRTGEEGADDGGRGAGAQGALDSTTGSSRAALPRTIDLIRTGDVSPNLETADGSTALIAASFAGQVEAVRILLREGCDPNYSNRNGRTALMAAAAGGHVPVCLELLQANADLLCHDLEGKSPIAHGNHAADGAEDDVVPVLMAARTQGTEAALAVISDPSETKLQKAAIESQRDALFASLGATPQSGSAPPANDFDSWRWRLPPGKQASVRQKPQVPMLPLGPAAVGSDANVAPTSTSPPLSPSPLMLPLGPVTDLDNANVGPNPTSTSPPMLPVGPPATDITRANVGPTRASTSPPASPPSSSPAPTADRITASMTKQDSPERADGTEGAESAARRHKLGPAKPEALSPQEAPAVRRKPKPKPKAPAEAKEIALDFKELQVASQQRRTRELQRAKKLSEMRKGRSADDGSASVPEKGSGESEIDELSSVGTARQTATAPSRRDDDAANGLGRDMAWEESRAVSRRSKQRMRGSTVSMQLAPGGAPSDRRREREQPGAPSALENAELMLGGMDEWRDRLDQLTLAMERPHHERGKSDGGAGAGEGAGAGGVEAAEIYQHPAELDYAAYMVGKRRYAEAEATLSELLKKQENKLGEGHIATAYTWRALGALEEARGRWHLALEYREKSMEVLFTVLGPAEKETSHAVELVATTLMQASRWAEAAHLYRHLSRKFRESNLPARRKFAQLMHERLEAVELQREQLEMRDNDESSRLLRFGHVRGPASLRNGHERRAIVPLRMLLTEASHHAQCARGAFGDHCGPDGAAQFEFCLAVEEYRRCTQGEAPVRFAAFEIFKHFIRPRQLLPQLSQRMRRRIVAEMELNGGRPSPTAYDEAQQAVIQDLGARQYAAFLESIDGLRWTSNHFVWQRHARGIVSAQALARGFRVRAVGETWKVALYYWRERGGISAAFS